MADAGKRVSIRLSVDGAQQAIDLLAPAEACTDVEHPNLVAWRRVRGELVDRPDAQAVAVFLGDLEPSPTDGPYELLLRSAVRG